MSVAVLFSGHMVDRPDRPSPRFPPERVPRARRAIAGAISQIDDGEAWAVSGLACGGDLLFAQQWLDTGRPLRVYLPRPLDEFVDESVAFAGEEWVDLFHEVISHPNLTVIGPAPEMGEREDPHSPNNLRMLEAAQAADRVHGIFLWDGEPGDGPGGTDDLVSGVRRSRGEVTILPP